jgi:hypothetical protein
MTNVLPIVVELGDVVDADLAALTTGTGAVADEVEEVMRVVRERCARSQDKRTLVPIVAVYTAIPER